MSQEIKENIKAYYIGSDIDNVLDYIQQKENIIKEVKNKIENTTINCDGVAEDLIDDILEILDKEDM